MRIRRRSLAGLVALNATLLVVLGAAVFAPRADAQARARSTYTMAAGTVKGQQMPIVYIVDESTGEMVGVSWDEQAKNLVGMGYRNIVADAADVGRARN
jgi:hypothetical protein